ncbi:MAG: hypothetical protein MPJ08_07830 [Nitrosopumilus sp.]|nr:hypothetical protein [Nitrosopumilus sp.]
MQSWQITVPADDHVPDQLTLRSITHSLYYGINFIETIIGEFDFDCIKENLETDETIDTGEGKLKVFGRILSNTLKDQKYACGVQLIQMAAQYFVGS